MQSDPNQAARPAVLAGLSVDKLSVFVGRHEARRQLVFDVSFSVERGETLCIVGESGSGKSLSSLAIIDLLPPDLSRQVNKIGLEGEDISSLRNAARVRGRRIGMIFQDPLSSLNPCLTVGSQLVEGFLHHRLGGRAESFEKAEHLLDRCGIREPGRRLRQYPHELSGGMRQRVMIAMALMCDPHFIIADEPTTALDVTVQAQILELLKRTQSDLGIGLIFITHDLGVVSRIAHKVSVMLEGRVVEYGNAGDVLSHPSHPYSEKLLKSSALPRRYERIAS